MITFDEALKIVSIYLSNLGQNIGETLTLIETKTIEKPFGWVFFYNTKEYIETNDSKYMLCGNAPLIVDRESGQVHETGTARPVDYYIEEYENSPRRAQ